MYCWGGGGGHLSPVFVVQRFWATVLHICGQGTRHKMHVFLLDDNVWHFVGGCPRLGCMVGGRRPLSDSKEASRATLRIVPDCIIANAQLKMKLPGACFGGRALCILHRIQGSQGTSELTRTCGIMRAKRRRMMVYAGLFVFGRGHSQVGSSEVVASILLA